MRYSLIISNVRLGRSSPCLKMKLTCCPMEVGSPFGQSSSGKNYGLLSIDPIPLNIEYRTFSKITKCTTQMLDEDWCCRMDRAWKVASRSNDGHNDFFRL